MKEKGTRGYKVLKMLFLVVAVIGIIFIGLFPMKNRNLLLKFVTDRGEFEYLETNIDLKNGIKCEYSFDGFNTLQISKIEIYGRFKTFCLEKMDVYDIMASVENVVNGAVELKGGKIELNTTDSGLHIVMNDEFGSSLYKLSASALAERIIYAGIYLLFITIVVFIGMLISEIRFVKDRNYHGIAFEVKKFGEDIVKYGQYMIYAAKADLRAEVANSYLNRLWWLLEPLFNMVVYVVVFGNVMGSSVEKYATFIFSALLMWNFFSKTISYSVKLVRNNKEIISKVYVPKFILLISNMILNFFKLLFSLIVLVVMLFAFRVHIGVNIIWVIPAYIMMMMMAFGAGMLLLHFGVYVDDLSYAVGILLSMLMFLSGIFYEVITTLPEPLNILMMCINPVAVFIDTMRNALLYNTVANMPLLGIWTAFSFILCCIGVHIVYKNENSYVKVV